MKVLIKTSKHGEVKAFKIAEQNLCIALRVMSPITCQSYKPSSVEPMVPRNLA